jgi:hypothetical protein
MSRWTKIFDQMNRSPSNVPFTDLCAMAEHLGYLHERDKGSHKIYRFAGRPVLSFQKIGSKAKVYQVRQLLDAIELYKIEVT